jgi:hypothetical protein
LPKSVKIASINDHDIDPWKGFYQLKPEIGLATHRKSFHSTTLLAGKKGMTGWGRFDQSVSAGN